MLQFIKPSGSIVAPGHLFIHLYLFSWVMIATTMIPLLFYTFLHFYFLVLKSTTVLLLGTSSSVPARPLFFHMPFHPRERTIIAIYHVSHSCLFCTRFAGFLFVSGKQAFAKPVGFRSACTTCISSTVSEPTQLTALLKNKTKNPQNGKPCKKKNSFPNGAICLLYRNKGFWLFLVQTAPWRYRLLPLNEYWPGLGDTAPGSPRRVPAGINPFCMSAAVWASQHGVLGLPSHLKAAGLQVLRLCRLQCACGVCWNKRAVLGWGTPGHH